MTPRRWSPALLVITMLTACESGRDATAPAAAREPALPLTADADVRTLLIALLARLDSLEARVERSARVFESRVDSVLATSRSADFGSVLAVPSVNLSRSNIDEQICLTLAKDGGTEMETNLEGGAGALAGVGAYVAANGVLAKLGVNVKLEPKLAKQTKIGLGYQACVPVNFVSTPRVASALSSPIAASENPSQGLVSQILTAAAAMGVNSQTATLALTALQQPANFSALFGGAQQLIGALPLDVSERQIYQDPAGTLRSVLGLGLGSVQSRLCGGSNVLRNLFSPELNEVCNAAIGFPTRQEALDLFNNLNGLPSSLSNLRNDLNTVSNSLSSACANLRNDLLGRTVVIPRTNVTEPLLGAVVGIFPQTTISPFVGFPSIC